METKDRRKGPRPVPQSGPKRRRSATKERKLRDSDVIYTPPKTFKRGRFLLQLASVVAVVCAIVLGMSIFFKVRKPPEVSGCIKYTPNEVYEASGIELGTNLMTLSRARISGNILSKLPYVDKVRVGIVLPDTVKIEITELDVVYAIEDAVGGWWLMNDQGKIVEQTNGVTAEEYTQVLGVRVEVPEVGQQAVAYDAGMTTIPVTGPEEQTGEDAQEGSEPAEPTEPTEPTTLAVDTPTIAVGVTGAEKLETAMAVLRQLGSSSICDHIDSVDVSKLQTLELWYDARFQINLGDATRLEYKIGALKATIDKMESYESGHLDISFINWPDKVGYTPFT